MHLAEPNAVEIEHGKIKYRTWGPAHDGHVQDLLFSPTTN